MRKDGLEKECGERLNRESRSKLERGLNNQFRKWGEGVWGEVRKEI